MSMALALVEDSNAILALEMLPEADNNIQEILAELQEAD
jgi:hypothetical protein